MIPSNVAAIIGEIYKFLVGYGVALAIFAIFVQSFRDAVFGGTIDRE